MDRNLFPIINFVLTIVLLLTFISHEQKFKYEIQTLKNIINKVNGSDILEITKQMSVLNNTITNIEMELQKTNSTIWWFTAMNNEVSKLKNDIIKSKILYKSLNQTVYGLKNRIGKR